MSGYSILYNLADDRIIKFLMQNDSASIYHHPAWLTGIAKTFGHTAFYLIEEDKNRKINGLIPFIHIKSKLRGNRLVSLPFSTYCDPLIEGTSFLTAVQYIQANFGNDIKIDIRTLKNLNDSLKNFNSISDYTTHILTLNDSLESTFESFHPTSVRASIRRAEKNNLDFTIMNNDNGLRIFYNLEVKLRKRLFLPPLPFKFYEILFEELNKSELINIAVIKKDNNYIAAGFILFFKDTCYLEYTASDKDSLNLYPNHALFWEIIKLAASQKMSKIDFGRTALDNKPLITFKEKWNSKASYITHYRYPDAGMIKNNKSKLNDTLKLINKYLPTVLLKAEGKLLYPHLD